MPFVNVMFLGCLTLVKQYMFESMHLDARLSTPMIKASESNGGKMQVLMLDHTAEAKLNNCCPFHEPQVIMRKPGAGFLHVNNGNMKINWRMFDSSMKVSVPFELLS